MKLYFAFNKSNNDKIKTKRKIKANRNITNDGAKEKKRTREISEGMKERIKLKVDRKA